MIVPALLLMTALAVLFQVSVPLFYLPLDLVLLVVIFSGLQRGRGMGLLMGVAGGMLLDALVSPHLGPRLISLCLAGLAADLLSTTVNREQWRLQAFAAAALTLTHDGLLFWAAWAMELSQGGGRRALMDYALPRLGVHAVAAVPFYFIFRAFIRARVFQDPLTRPPRVLRKLPQ